MGKDLTDTERAIIQQVVLDRCNPLRLNKKIATHFGLTINQVRHIRSKSVFQAEYERQLAIYQQSFDEIQLADRKERVLAMQELYEKIPDIRVALKLKILAQIRAEVGQDQPIQHVHAVHVPGVNVPPRATTCWLSLLIPTAECETGAMTTIRSCVPETSTPCR